MRLLVLLLFFVSFFNVSNAQTNVFNNIKELNSCISGYQNFDDYKSKLKNCYENKNIQVDNKTLNSISNQTEVIKKSGFNLQTRSNAQNILDIKKYISKNPDKIYGITEDINQLYNNNLINNNLKNNFLFQSYNSFSFEALRIANTQTIFDKMKELSEKIAEVYKESGTIKQKALNIIKVVQTEIVANPAVSNSIAAVVTSTTTIAAVKETGLVGAKGEPLTPVTLEIDQGSLSENSSDVITITATIEVAEDEDMIIVFSPSGSATEGSDYEEIPNITITAGSLTGSSSFSLTDDSVYEGDESISFSVDTAASTGDFIIFSAPTFTITENESAPTVTLATSGTSIAENAGSSLTLTATISQVADEDITVNLGAAGTSTNGTDYGSLTSITVSAGATTGTVSFTPTDDTIYEGNETAIISISTISGADATESGSQSVTITIVENDSTPVVTLSTSATSIAENAGSSLTLTATLSNATTEDVIVALSTSGTGTEGTDYATISDITISAGDTTGTVSFTPTDDSVYEGNETGTVAISSVSGGSANESGTPQEVTITITDNESAPTVTLSTSASSIAENAGSSLTLTATLSKDVKSS